MPHFIDFLIIFISISFISTLIFIIISHLLFWCCLFLFSQGFKKHQAIDFRSLEIYAEGEHWYITDESAKCCNYYRSKCEFFPKAKSRSSTWSRYSNLGKILKDSVSQCRNSCLCSLLLYSKSSQNGTILGAHQLINEWWKHGTSTQ